jgi:hypothetical protein
MKMSKTNRSIAIDDLTLEAQGIEKGPVGIRGR